jgi:hypothetical protein
MNNNIKENNNEENEQILMLSLDNDENHICFECKKEKAFIFSDNLYLCRECFYLQKKAIIDCYIHKQYNLYISYNQITEKIFLGNEDTARDKKILIKNNISNILVCAEGCDIFYPDIFKYKILYLDDAIDENLLCWLYEAFNFIDSSEKNIYIHCVMGVSRSASITIGYLMYKQKKDYEEVFNFVKSKREEIEPNSGFVKQLKDLNKILKENNYNIECLKKYENEKNIES